MFRRMFGAAFFNAHTYEEIEGDPRAITQAVGVVLLVTVCDALGSLIPEILGDAMAREVLLDLGSALAFGVVRWALWVTIVLMVGRGLLRASGTQTSWAEMGRVLGFAYAPGVGPSSRPFRRLATSLSWLPSSGSWPRQSWRCGRPWTTKAPAGPSLWSS